MRQEMSEFLQDVVDEVARARLKFRPFASAHEGYGVLLEELDEVWVEIKLSQPVNGSTVGGSKLYRELVQAAAMCLHVNRVYWR